MQFATIAVVACTVCIANLMKGVTGGLLYLDVVFSEFPQGSDADFSDTFFYQTSDIVQNVVGNLLPTPISQGELCATSDCTVTST